MQRGGPPPRHTTPDPFPNHSPPCKKMAEEECKKGEANNAGNAAAAK